MSEDHSPQAPHTVTPEEADAAIQQAIVAHLGDNWRSEWILVHEGHHIVRLNRGTKNLDFQCDLLGDVEVIEREASPVQLSGRLIAWTVLVSSMLVALTIAKIAGVI